MKSFLLLLLPAALLAQPVTVRVDSLEEAHEKAAKIRNACPWPGAYVRTVQGTNSMWPALDEGCLLVVAQKPWKEVDVGDILSMDRRNEPFMPEGWCLHRAKVKDVNRRGEKAFILRGDNNRHPDSGWFHQRHYGGTVYAVVRFKDVPHFPSMSYAQWLRKQQRANASTEQTLNKPKKPGLGQERG